MRSLGWLRHRMVRRAPANRNIVLQNLPESVHRIREAGAAER
jgi:hypothetical protein